jgi:hypothetical protein
VSNSKIYLVLKRITLLDESNIISKYLQFQTNRVKENNWINRIKDELGRNVWQNGYEKWEKWLHFASAPPVAPSLHFPRENLTVRQAQESPI